jgi:hypothetical protein
MFSLTKNCTKFLTDIKALSKISLNFLLWVVWAPTIGMIGYFWLVIMRILSTILLSIKEAKKAIQDKNYSNFLGILFYWIVFLLPLWAIFYSKK